MPVPSKRLLINHIPARIGFELCAVDADTISADSIIIDQKPYDLLIHPLDLSGKIFVVVNDGLIARFQALHQTDDFNITLGFCLKVSRGIDPMVVSMYQFD